MVCSPEGNILSIRLVPIKTTILTISGNLTSYMTLQPIIQTKSNPEIPFISFHGDLVGFQHLRFVMGMVVEDFREKRSGKSFFQSFYSHITCFQKLFDDSHNNTKKKPPEMFYKEICPKKFRKTHRKGPVPRPFLIKLWATPFLHNTSG